MLPAQNDLIYSSNSKPETFKIQVLKLAVSHKLSTISILNVQIEFSFRKTKINQQSIIICLIQYF